VVKIDESGITLVDFRKIGYRDEPFIMIQQAYQIFYVKDPTSENWYVVLHEKNKGRLLMILKMVTPFIHTNDND